MLTDTIRSDTMQSFRHHLSRHAIDMAKITFEAGTAVL